MVGDKERTHEAAKAQTAHRRGSRPFTHEHAHATHLHRLEKLLRVFHKLDAKQDGKVCACMCAAVVRAL